MFVAKRAALRLQYSGQGSSLNLVLFARPKYCVTASVFVCITLDVFVLASVDFSFIFEI
jgi:hypothetical protein